MPELPSLNRRTAPSDLATYVADSSNICSTKFGNWIDHALSTSDDQEYLLTLLTEAMVLLSCRLRSVTMVDKDYEKYVTVLLVYSKFPRLLESLTKYESFQLLAPNSKIEKDTVLGPFFRLSPLEPMVRRSCLDSRRTLGEDPEAQNPCQMLSSHQKMLAFITDGFIQAGPEVERRLFGWFESAIDSFRISHRQSREGPLSDGFLLNVTAVLDHLLQRHAHASFSSSQDINSTRNRDYATLEVNIFDLAAEAYHYGFQVVIQGLEKLSLESDDIERLTAARKSTVDKFVPQICDPNLSQQYEMRNSLRKYFKSLNQKSHTRFLEIRSKMKVLKCVLYQDTLLNRCLRFTEYLTRSVLRVATGSDYSSGRQVSHTLTTIPIQAFTRANPQIAVDVIIENLLFIYNHVPEAMFSVTGGEFLLFCVTFLQSPRYIQKASQKGSLIALLAHGIKPVQNYGQGVWGKLLLDGGYDGLIPALLESYVESDTASNKMRIRSDISCLISWVLTNCCYKKQLIQHFMSHKAFFVRLSTCLVEEAGNGLQEALTLLLAVRQQQDDETRGGRTTQDYTYSEQARQWTARKTKDVMQATNATVHMMSMLSMEIIHSFTVPDVVSRLANFLNHNLEALTNPETRVLEIDDGRRYDFQLKNLLLGLVSIYLNLQSNPDFTEAVAENDWPCTPDRINQVTSNLEYETAHCDKHVPAAWSGFCRKIEQEIQTIHGEVPPQFEDAITRCLMKNPVVLPSNNIVDRSTIEKHWCIWGLWDPFTRVAMDPESVTIDYDLKHSIQKWRTGTD